MSAITLGGCAPDVLLSHLALYGLAAILESGGVTGLRAGWHAAGGQRPHVSAPGLTGERAAEVISRHARQATTASSWLHRSITLGGTPRALMSPRLSTIADEATWRHTQQQRHQVLDELTTQGRWLDLRLLAAIGEPCYWIRDRHGAIQQDSAASKLEMQPRNQGSEFVGNRLRKIADAVARRTGEQILAGLTGASIRDEAERNAVDSRTATGLAEPGPTDNAVAWCALWGISQLPLAMRVRDTAITTGHLGRARSEFFYAPVWQSPWRPARLRAVLASAQVRIVASSGLDRTGRPVRNPPSRVAAPPHIPMYTSNEIAAAERSLAERGVVGVVRFAINRFGSDNAPERRAMRGEPIPVRAAE
jgi:CRISPR-associated protein Csb3